VIEICLGHKGSFGILKENFDVVLKVDRPVALKACPCPLSAIHMHQGMDLFETKHSTHPFIQPIEVLAYAYGFLKEKNHLL
jgi:glycerol-3-phosphate dehydrogenase subunit C